jgi:hypothetical protein
MVPTQDQIVERIHRTKANDMLGFEWHEYLRFLDYDNVKQFLKEDADIKPEDVKPPELTREGMLTIMHDYMGFAWDKANNCRGISANRSIMHYIAWTFLAGDLEFCEQLEEEYAKNYQYYGKEILIMICKFYNWDWKDLDDGVRTNG